MSKEFSILMVDDDVEDHLIMRGYFEDLQQGDVVKFVCNGQEAVNYLGDAEVTYPQLIVLDLNMPIMNGTQTLLHIKRDPNLKHIPVIVYSTSENENEKRKCLSFGAVDYIVKPMGYAEGLELTKQFVSYLSGKR